MKHYYAAEVKAYTLTIAILVNAVIWTLNVMLLVGWVG